MSDPEFAGFPAPISSDGAHWMRSKPILLDTSKKWGIEVRTSLGLFDEGGGRYTVFYTAFEGKPDWDGYFKNNRFSTDSAVGFVELELRYPR